MSMFQKIGDGAKDGWHAIKFKVDQFMRIQQAEGEKKTLNREIVVIRDQVGQAAFNLFQNGTLVQEELREFCQKMSDNQGKIAQVQKQIEDIRAESFQSMIPTPSRPSLPIPGGIFCPNCGQNLPADAVFCGNCGQKLANLHTEETNL